MSFHFPFVFEFFLTINFWQISLLSDSISASLIFDHFQFRSVLIAASFSFDQFLFQSVSILASCIFDQLYFRSVVFSISCIFDQFHMSKQPKHVQFGQKEFDLIDTVWPTYSNGLFLGQWGLKQQTDPNTDTHYSIRNTHTYTHTRAHTYTLRQTQVHVCSY